MDSARHSLVKDLLAAACLEPASERLSFVARACGDDALLRREVESLLAYAEEPEIISNRAPRFDRKAAGRLRRGRVLASRYRVERLLGVGGMGEVYAAYDAMLRETIALKILPLAGAEQRRRLVDEVRLARQVTHPGVCRVYDIGEDSGMPFLTMELIDGEDLATRIARSGPMPSDQVTAIALRLASALAAAHEAGVLHRDLKPSNILIARGGGLYITDFGIATSAASRRATSDRSADWFGTPAYMAPEECVPGGVATQQTDLYSLGLILYELLTGTAAFDAPDLDSLLELQRSAAPDPPSRVLQLVDANLEALVLQLLEKDPSRRPESARAVMEALATSPEARDEGSAPAAIERRQIVTLCCQLEAPADAGGDGRWPELVRMFQARCSASCRLKGGRIARHLARGLLVHFGLPRAGEQDAERAIETALEIVGELRERPLVQPGDEPPNVTVVADALPAIVRGGRVLLAGDALETMTAATFPPAQEEVIVSAALLPLLRGAFTTVVCDGPGGRPWHRITRARHRLVLEGGAGRLSPFTGRELELRQLEQCWRDAAAGRGQVVQVSGEAGQGKSRIVHELWQRVRDQGLGYEARCSSLHSNTPLHPFVSMVEQLARIGPDDDAETRTAKLRRTLAPLGARADELLPVFSAWLFSAASTGVAAGPATTPETDRRAAIAVLEECVRVLAASRPVLLLCEDVQWSDPTTREAIDRLVALVRTERVLLVLTLRPDFSPPWRGSNVVHVALQPLRDDEARALLAALPVAGPTGSTDALVERADGNPLYLEELAKHAAETGGAARALGVPPSLHGLLAARFDRLGTAKRLVQAAAVCGRSASYPLLRAVATDPDDGGGLDAALTRLLDAEILLQRGPRPNATFTFRHALLRDVAYDSLSARDRRRLHGMVAQALFDLDPENCASNPELVARHWNDAGLRDQAFQWWKRAGLRALERSAYSEAEHHLEQALRALPAAIEIGERRRRQLELGLALASLEMGRHGPGSTPAARRARKAEALCAGLELDDTAARAFLLSARIRLARGELRATGRMLGPLRALHDRIRDPYLRAAVLTQEGNLLSSLGRLDEAERVQDLAIEAYARAHQHPAGALTADPLTLLQMTRAGNEWLRGRDTESRRWAGAAIAHADRLGHPFSRAIVRVLGASLAVRWGDRTRFAELLEAGVRQAEALGAHWLIHMAALYAPLADASLEPAEAARRMRSALEVSPGSWLFRSLPWSELAELLARAGRSEEAMSAMSQAAVEARRRDPCLLPEIERRRGELLARLGHPAQAEAALRRGLRAARRSGAFGLELRCATSLARLLSAHGRTAAARRTLAAVLARMPDEVDAPERAKASSMLAAIGGHHGP